MTGILSAATLVTLRTLLTLLTLLWAFGVASVSAWAALRAKAAARPGGRPHAPGQGPSALLLRPCAGAEPTLARALSSTERARTSVGSFPLRVRFAVASEADAAAPIAAQACADLRALAGGGLDARVVVTGAVGPNRKADQLARALRLEAADRSNPPAVIIVADSDVDLDGVSLDALVHPLSDPNVGASWAAPVEVAPRTLADRASAAVLDASLHAFPLLATLDPQGLVGKLVAVRSDALAQVGGFDALVAHLGEDMELARRLRAAGYACVCAPLLAPSLAQGRSLRTVIGRYGRWLTVIRGQRPALLATYPLVLAATPLLLGLAAVACAVDGPLALVGAGAAIVARLAIAGLARAVTGQPLRPWSLAVDATLADLLLLAACARALGSRQTSWRGVTLRLDEAGRLTEDVPS